MRAAPVHQETIHLRRSAFQGFTVWAGIDRGCSLTKVAFVPEDSSSSDSNSSDSDSVVPVRCLTFLNDDFEDALHTMKEHAQLPDKGELHVTGVGCDTYKDKIKEIIGLDVVYIDEFLTIGYGVYVLFNASANPEQLFHPTPEYKRQNIKNENLEKLQSELKKELNTFENSMLPAVVLYVGSGAAFMHISEEGNVKFLREIGMSGKPFMGLANALLGTTNYNDIMDMAAKGEQRKVDWQAKDILKEDPNSPYGQCPADLPILPFGKASQNDWSANKCSKDDIAQALVSFFVAEMVGNMFFSIKSTKTSRVYLTGNFFRAEIVRKLFLERGATFIQESTVDIKAIKTGHVGAITAMLTKKEDVEKVTIT